MCSGGSSGIYSNEALALFFHWSIAPNRMFNVKVRMLEWLRFLFLWIGDKGNEIQYIQYNVL